MDAENNTFPNLSLNENTQTTKKSSLGKKVIWAQLIVFLLGFGLLIYVTSKAGFSNLTGTISRVGWGFVFIVFVNGLRHILRAFCIYLIVPPKHRLFKFSQALAARLGGEAVSVVTFTGPFLGDATKAALLKKDIPLSHGGAAIIVDNILYYISVVAMILGGVIALSLSYNGVRSLQTSLMIVTVISFLVLMAMILMLWFRFKPLGFTIRRLAKRDLVPKFLEKRKDVIFKLEENVYQFYLHHRATFFTVFGINVIAHILSVGEVYTVLYLLDFSSTVNNAFIIESLTKVINLAFSFVPGAIGVYEGGNGVILNLLGFTTATGIALALVRRGAILFWTLIGLLILLWRTTLHGKQGFFKRAVNRNS